MSRLPSFWRASAHPLHQLRAGEVPVLLGDVLLPVGEGVLLAKGARLQGIGVAAHELPAHEVLFDGAGPLARGDGQGIGLPDHAAPSSLAGSPCRVSVIQTLTL